MQVLILKETKLTQHKSAGCLYIGNIANNFISTQSYTYVVGCGPSCGS